MPVVPDSQCIWSDGSITGYCTAFYKDGVEIGNIVNPLRICIDGGFGGERLDMIANGTPQSDALETSCETVTTIVESGYRPGNKEQGYVLRKLLRRIHKMGGTLDHPFFKDEVERQKRFRVKYLRLRDRYSAMSADWWFDTHGIDLAAILPPCPKSCATRHSSNR